MSVADEILTNMFNRGYDNGFGLGQTIGHKHGVKDGYANAVRDFAELNKQPPSDQSGFVREVMEKQNLNITQLANIVGISRRAMSRYACGTLDTPPDILFKLRNLEFLK